MRLGNVPGECDEKADRVLGSRDDRRLGRVRDDDPLPRGRLDVDVVDADPRAADHLQPGASLDQLAVELRRGADHDRVVVADPLREIVAAVDVDLEPLAEEVDPRLRDRLADEDSHTRAAGSALAASGPLPRQ